MKKIRNENELLKEALRVGTRYFEARGAGKFESTDHVDAKARALYLLLVKDQLIQPLSREDESVQNMKHKLALWISRTLPDDHPLLN